MTSSSPRLKTVMNSASRAQRDVKEEIIEGPYVKSTLPAEYAADPFLAPTDIAKELQVDSKTVSRWAKNGKFGEAPNVIFLPGGTHRRIRQSAYLEAIEEMKKKYGN